MMATQSATQLEQGFDQGMSQRSLRLMETGVVTLFALAAAAWLVLPAAALLIAAAAAMLFLLRAPLRHAVMVFLCLMMFDLQRPMGAEWIYVDLTFAALLIPVMRRGSLPPFWWVFAPYTVYLFLDGMPRALKPAWYYGFAVRSVIAFIAYMACALARAEDIYFVFLGLLMIPLTIYGIYQLSIGGLGQLFFWMNPHFSELPWTDRAYSLLWQPNFLGGIAAIVLVSLVALAMKGIRPRLSYTLALVSFIALLISGSRGAMISAAAAVCFAAWTAGRARLIPVMIPLGLALLLIGNRLHLPAIERLVHGDEVSNHARWLGNKIGVAEFLEHPIFGLGPTNFETILPTVQAWEFTSTMPVNNMYLEHLAELGLLGFAGFWAPLAAFAAIAWSYREDAVVLACLCMLLVFAMHGLFDYLIELGPPYLFLFYSFCGVLAGRLQALSAARAQAGSPLEREAARYA